MSLLNKPAGWGFISKTLHWLIALLILAAMVLGLSAENMPLSPAKLTVFIYHKSIGLTVLGLAVIRLLWKLTSPPPGPASGLSRRNQQLAGLGHWLLYGLMFALPLSGWIVNSAANIPFKWMHWLAVPAIPGISSQWKDPAAEIHRLLFIILAVAVIGHASMAVIHHYRHNSNVFTRMWPAGSVWSWSLAVTAILAVAGTIYVDSTTPAASSGNRPLSTNTLAAPASLDKAAEHTDQQWQIVAEHSRLGFIGRYDEVPFKGEFKQFTAAMYFDPQQAQRGYFDVLIDTASITTYSDDWDASLPDSEWFSTAAYPQAHYQTRSIIMTEQGFRAEGVLTLKGISKPVPLDFQWQPTTDNTVNFTATAVVNRGDFAIGDGMWAEDPTIGFTVDIHIQLQLTPL